MAEEVTKPAVDWDRLDGTEPDWPDKKPKVHICNGCAKPRPVEVFELVETPMAGQIAYLVLCDECRSPKKTKSDKPFDDREVVKA